MSFIAEPSKIPRQGNLPEANPLSESPAAPPPKFSHPSEAAFARILDFYGIEWQYEPREFALERDAQGHVIEAFRPDFYLPQQDLYVELTTLRPQLSTHKNRKLRRMKELYPEINIKLFKRREMRDLMVKFGLYDEAEDLHGSEAQVQAHRESGSDE
jgi:hypoxanthine phosphoribosyltransferase